MKTRNPKVHESMLCKRGGDLEGGNGNFGRISHVSGPKLSFWRNFQMILHGFAWRSSKNRNLRSKSLKINQQSQKYFKKCHTGWGPVRVGARSGLGPIWALMGPIWAIMEPTWVLLDRSGHDQITTFGPISHASGPTFVFWLNFSMILHVFCRRSWISFFNQKP